MRRPTHFYWLLDTSDSMQADGKIDAMNECLLYVGEHIRDVAEREPRIHLVVHVIQFGRQPRWVSEALHAGVSGREFHWSTDFHLASAGPSYLGAALGMLAEELVVLPNHAHLPVICLVTDGFACDNYEEGLRKLDETGWGRYAFRIAIAIGDDADIEVCTKFASPEVPVLRADTADQIRGYYSGH